MKHFLDVGSNVGQTFTDFLNRTTDFDGAHIWCIEPSPRHLMELMKMASAQSANFNIHVCPFGISDETTILPFYQKDDARGDSFCALLGSDHWTENINTGYALHVSVISICDFLNFYTKEGDEVTIKLDCEGSEYDILGKLFMHGKQFVPRIKKIYLELHTTEHNKPKNAEPLIHGLQQMGITIEKWNF